MAYSNPRPTMGDYTLRDSSGKRVSLSALVKGELDEVDIVGAEELDAARANPSHPMSLKATTVPAAMYQQNLPRIFGGVVTPALWARAKDEYGLFGATQRLSILLPRPSPLEGHNNYSSARLLFLMLASVRRLSQCTALFALTQDRTRLRTLSVELGWVQ